MLLVVVVSATTQYIQVVCFDMLSISDVNKLSLERYMKSVEFMKLKRMKQV